MDSLHACKLVVVAETMEHGGKVQQKYDSFLQNVSGNIAGGNST